MQSAAESSIIAAGLVVGTVTDAHSDTIGAGAVISQQPSAGASVTPDSAVSFVVSLGPVAGEGEGEGEGEDEGEGEGEDEGEDEGEGEGEGEGEDLTMHMVSVPAGSFIMGAIERELPRPEEEPRHMVTLDAYEIGTYEVTNSQFAAVMNWALERDLITDASGFAYAGDNLYLDEFMLLELIDPDCQIIYENGEFEAKVREGKSMANHPVLEVSWFGAVAFCNWLSEMEGLDKAYDLTDLDLWPRNDPVPNGYRLPTEAEWERAAVWDADAEKHYWFGIQSDTIDEGRANFHHANPLGLSSEPETSPVGYYAGQTSPVGCYDMSGNVWEWCQDWYYQDYYQEGDQTNPLPPDPERFAGMGVVKRGGAWNSLEYNVRGAYRIGYYATNMEDWVGFRVARTP
jgi:formylglycine-generating enzyme required for sulfatase activity